MILDGIFMVLASLFAYADFQTYRTDRSRVMLVMSIAWALLAVHSGCSLALMV